MYSDFVIEELKIDYSEKEIKLIFDNSLEVLVFVKTEKQDFDEAKKISIKRKIPLGDLLHAILAKKNDAILVSRDKHFLLLSDIIVTKKPEELL